MLALAAATLLTGALHLDALADSADALSARTRERALEIMRDHAIGSYGAVAIALDLLLKAGALSTLASHHTVLRTAIAAGALSRAAARAARRRLAVRARGGRARRVTHPGRPRTRRNRRSACRRHRRRDRRDDGAIAAGVAAAIVVALAVCYRRWIGGVTGDTLGAAVELTEIAVFLTAGRRWSGSG